MVLDEKKVQRVGYNLANRGLIGVLGTSLASLVGGCGDCDSNYQHPQSNLPTPMAQETLGNSLETNIQIAQETPSNSLETNIQETNTNIQFSDPKDTVLALHETLQKGDIEGHVSYGGINYLFEERSAFAKECRIEIIEVRYKVHPYSGEQSAIVVHKAFYNDKLSHVMFTKLGWRNNKWKLLNSYGRDPKETLLINRDLINIRNSLNKEPMHW